MQRQSILAITTAGLLMLISAALLNGVADAQESQPKQTVEPVFRVPKIKGTVNRPDQDPETEEEVTAQPAGVNYQAPIFPSNPLPSESNLNSAAQTNNAAHPAAPVARVADARGTLPDKVATNLVPVIDATADVETHPLDRAIEIAHRGLENMQSTIYDYTAVMVKRERVGNSLSEPMFMKIKVRNPRNNEERNVPFSIYMKFVKPRSVVGREVIWVEGQNNNNLIVHDTNPLVRFKNLHLKPNGFLAMKGNRYPIYEAGLEKLVQKLIEKAERDRAAGHCEVKYQAGAKINKRPCTLIEVTHNQRRAPYEFHVAKVYIDDEYQIPVRFAAYDWPVGNQKAPLIEEYTYVNVALNVGLSDSDFNIANRGYNFAK